MSQKEYTLSPKFEVGQIVYALADKSIRGGEIREINCSLIISEGTNKYLFKYKMKGPYLYDLGEVSEYELFVSSDKVLESLKKGFTEYSPLLTK